MRGAGKGQADFSALILVWVAGAEALRSSGEPALPPVISGASKTLPRPPTRADQGDGVLLLACGDDLHHFDFAAFDVLVGLLHDAVI